MSKSPFTSLACQSPEEYGLLAAVLANPADDLPKLVYADWLDERSDSRGAFLRSLLAWRTNGGKLPKTTKGATKGWRGLLGYDFDAAVAPLYGQPKWAGRIRGVMRPGLEVRTRRAKADDAIPVGASKVGGVPDLPTGSVWPMNKKSPMAFLGQWSLEELTVSPAASLLPRTGLLSFFVDLQPYIDDLYDSPPPGLVVYTPDGDGLARLSVPKELPKECRLKPCRVSFTERGTFPVVDSVALRRAGVNKEAEIDDYGSMMDLRPKLTMGRVDTHQILGHHQPIQEDPAQYKKEKDWVLLSQFGPDSACGLDVGDGGEFYFLVRTEHLARARFDKVYMELQMG